MSDAHLAEALNKEQDPAARQAQAIQLRAAIGACGGLINDFSMAARRALGGEIDTSS